MNKDLIKYEFLFNQKMDKEESLILKKRFSKLNINFNSFLNEIRKILNVKNFKIVFKVSFFDYQHTKYETGYRLFFLQIILQNEMGKEIGILFFKSDDEMDQDIHNAFSVNSKNTYEKRLDLIVNKIENMKNHNFYLDLNVNFKCNNKDFLKNKRTLLLKNEIIRKFHKDFLKDYTSNNELKIFLNKNSYISINLLIDNGIKWNLKRMHASKIQYSENKLLKDFNHKAFLNSLSEIKVLSDSITDDLINESSNINEVLELVKLLDY